MLVGATDEHRPAAVLEHFLDGGDFARGIGTAGHHDVERFVEHDFLAALERAEKFGLHRHAHLAAAGVNVDGGVVVQPEHGAVPGRRLRELVDFISQGGDVLARLAQGVRELLVLGDRLGELALAFEQALFERTDALGRILEPPSECGDLVLESGRDHAQPVDLRSCALLVHETLRSLLRRHPRRDVVSLCTFAHVRRSRHAGGVHGVDLIVSMYSIVHSRMYTPDRTGEPTTGRASSVRYSP